MEPEVLMALGLDADQAAKATGQPRKKLRAFAKELDIRPRSELRKKSPLSELTQEERDTWLVDRLYDMLANITEEMNHTATAGRGTDKAAAAWLSALTKALEGVIRCARLLMGRSTENTAFAGVLISERIAQDSEAARISHQLLECLARDSGGVRVGGIGRQVAAGQAPPAHFGAAETGSNHAEAEEDNHSPPKAREE